MCSTPPCQPSCCSLAGSVRQTWSLWCRSLGCPSSSARLASVSAAPQTSMPCQQICRRIGSCNLAAMLDAQGEMFYDPVLSRCFGYPSLCHDAGLEHKHGNHTLQSMHAINALRMNDRPHQLPSAFIITSCMHHEADDSCMTGMPGRSLR